MVMVIYNTQWLVRFLPKGGTMPYSFLDHTADVGLEMTGSSLEDLFSAGVDGLYHLLFGKEDWQSVLDGVEGESVEVELEAAEADEELLLIQWLRLLLTEGDVNYRYIHSMDISIQRPTSFQPHYYLRAQCKCVAMTEEIRSELLDKDIKAPTYHALVVSEEKGLARVIFDV